MKTKHLFMIAVAAVLAFAAANVNAQSIVMSGSSAIFIEIGQASATQALSGAAIANCGWSDNSTVGKQFTLTDTRPTTYFAGTVANLVDSGNQGWITWTINGGTCAGTTAATLINVNVMVSADSSVGNRCFFAVPTCTVSTTHTSSQTGAGILNSAGFTETPDIPAAVLAKFPLTINAAATDIRPEDALFATQRGFTGCGYPIVTGSQYEGIGFQTTPAANSSLPAGLVGEGIANGGQNGAGSGPFNLAIWALQGDEPFSIATGSKGPAAAAPAFTVQEVGAVPVVVFVNPSLDTGLGSLQISNVDRGVLAGFLDGSYQRVADFIPQAWSGSGATEVYTFVREFLSGTYNTTEFAIPDSVENQSGMDVGLAAVDAGLGSFPPLECAGIPSSVQVTSNTPNGAGTGLQLADASTVFGGTYYRVRTIGTGSMVSAVEGKANSLGYAFWSAANFSSAGPTTAKYLTVDGVDPIQEAWSDGLVPTSGNGNLPNVTLTHVRDGSYPIFSILRVVCGTNCTATSNLVAAAGNFLSESQPDFVPANSAAQNPLRLVRSHFSPPGVVYTGCTCNGSTCVQPYATPIVCSPSNGNSSNEASEVGGDVGGVVYTQQADGDYAKDTGNDAGEVNHRQ